MSFLHLLPDPRSAQLIVRSVIAPVVLLVAACGGGGGDPPPAPTESVFLSGTAATGAPMVGATIVVLDATGTEVQVCRDASNAVVACTTGADGRFTLGLRAGAQAPLVFSATPADGGLTHVSMLDQAQDGDTVNVTPITTLIAAALSPSGNPHTLQPGDFDPASLQAALAEIVAALQPLFDAVGTTVNPITGAFVADGTGLDRALDVLDVQMGPDANGVFVVSAEIRLNGDDVQPASVVIAGGGNPVTQNMASVTPAALPVDGVAPLLADLLQRMGACYNLPHAMRVNTATTPHSLIASACTGLFVDGDPASYLSNGYRAGPGAAFSGMFGNRDTSGPAGVPNALTFDQPVYEYTRDGAHAGDVVFTFRWRDLLGNQGWEQGVVRMQNDRFHFIGNQYAYDAHVRPYVQRREFLEADSSDFSYFSTGYNTWVRNHLDGAGNPLFDRVQFTSPGGRVLTVWPAAGLDRLNYRLTNGTVSSTSVINLQWGYFSGGSVGPSGTDLADLETGRVFARDAAGNPQPWTSEQIQAIPNQGKWRLDFFLAGNASSTPDATQWHTTQSRARTLPEVQAMTWAAFVPEVVGMMRADIDAARGGIPFDAPDVIELQPTQPGDPLNYWSVPSGALTPTSVLVNGSYTDGVITQRFNDGQSVRTSMRTTRIFCARASAADAHCELDGSGNSTGRFNAGSVIHSIDLWGRTDRGVEQANLYALYRRLP